MGMAVYLLRRPLTVDGQSLLMGSFSISLDLNQAQSKADGFLRGVLDTLPLGSI